MLNRRHLMLSVAPFAVASCSQTGGGTLPLPEVVQQAIEAACGFIADLGPLAQLILAFVPIPGVSTVTAIANQVCAAIEPVRAARMAVPQASASALVVVKSGKGKDVLVTGRFVR